MNWQLYPFIKHNDINPILKPQSETLFHCPIRKTPVRWEEKDVFNPAAVVKEDKVYLLYRAEDTVGRFAGTSRIGLAESQDGFHFVRHTQPVLYPDNDFMKVYEWEGGCEDPRVVESGDGTFVMTYTAYDGTTARLCVATSNDLFSWQKHGLIFGSGYKDLWCKSGSIICRLEGQRLIATRINGLYWMYWGESKIYLAHSEDLIHWSPVFWPQLGHDQKGYGEQFLAVFGTRHNRFDSSLVEPGPPAVLTRDGIVFIYNGRNTSLTGDSNLPDGTYAGGQVLLDPKDPSAVIARVTEPFIKPEQHYEITGQVNNVSFLEGLVYFKNRWLLYYGTADSQIAVASCKSWQD